MHMAGAAGEDLLRLLRAGPGPRLPIYHRSLHGEFRRITGSGVNATKTTRLLSRPGEFHPEPLTGRVEDWRAGLGRSLYSLFLALSFASVTLSRPCHVSSPRHVERSVRISRTALSCLLHLKGYGTYRAGATFGISQRTL